MARHKADLIAGTIAAFARHTFPSAEHMARLSDPDVAAELARQAMEQAPLLQNLGPVEKGARRSRAFAQARYALPCTDLAKAVHNYDPALWVRMPSKPADILGGGKALGKVRYASHPRDGVDPVRLIY